MLFRKIAWILLLGGAAPGFGIAQGSLVPLKVEAVLPIESEVPVEPSGLCLRDGRLFSISDDTDDCVFEIVREGDHARFVPFLRFTPPPVGPSDYLDFEGIETGPSGSFFLISEQHARVLQVFPDGASRWVMDSVAPLVKDLGLLRYRNAGIEGMAVLGENHFLFAAERQPRGLIEWNDGEAAASFLNITAFSSELSLLRLPDYAGLATDGKEVFGLFRNADLIVPLERDANGKWTEGTQGWSFASITRSETYRYEEDQFGHAEGLAVDATHFYVVLDTNGAARRNDPNDRRPLFLIFSRPE